MQIPVMTFPQQCQVRPVRAGQVLLMREAELERGAERGRGGRGGGGGEVGAGPSGTRGRGSRGRATSTAFTTSFDYHKIE